MNLDINLSNKQLIVRKKVVSFIKNYAKFNNIAFEYEHLKPVKTEKINGGFLFDFGKELFGYVYIKNEALWCLSVIICTVIFAYIMHIASKKIIRINNMERAKWNIW